MVGFPGGTGSEEPTRQSRRHKMWVPSLGGKISWRRAWKPTLVFLPGEFGKFKIFSELFEDFFQHEIKQ